MAEYIERERAIQQMADNFRQASVDGCDNPFYQVAEDTLADLPAADVVEVVHGEWIDKPTGRYGQWQSWCSACGKHSGIGGIESNRHKPYCPNCGAKMDGGKHETD